METSGLAVTRPHPYPNRRSPNMIERSFLPTLDVLGIAHVPREGMVAIEIAPCNRSAKRVRLVTMNTEGGVCTCFEDFFPLPVPKTCV